MMREALAKMTQTHMPEPPEIASVMDTKLECALGYIPLRIYNPTPGLASPVLLFIHGGGHMCGDLEVYDGICRNLAKVTRRLVVAVDYSLAPEFPYPTALNECTAVIRGLWNHLKANKVRFKPDLTLVGDSGGGALSATLSALSQKDASLPIQSQALIYPSLDYTLSSDTIESLAKGYLLEKDRIEWYFDHYFQKGENRKEASPLFMPITSKLPPTLLITAGFCPLKGEAKEYKARLENAGVMIQHHHEPSQIHAFLNLETLVPEACQRSYSALASFLEATPDQSTFQK